MSRVRTLDVYRRVAGARIRSHLRYRTSFFFGTIGSFSAGVLDYMVIVVVFNHLPRLGDWSFAEVSFLFGTSAVAFGITDLVVGSLEKIDVRIREGSFDQVLTRPLGALPFVLADDFALRRMGKVVQGVLVMAYALPRVDVNWTAGRVLMVPLMILGGMVIFSSIFVAGSCIQFWTVGSSEAMNAFTYGGNFLTSYPLSIYGTWFRRVLGFGLGLAFVNWFPTLYVLDREDPFGLPSELALASPAVAALAAGVAVSVWRVAVRHYRSTGS